MSAKETAPIIIKKVKKGGGDGHHGGAWKVAYADFVTAMMAFFLLMWLLNATTESQRKGIADYFNPSIPLSRVSGGGDGSFGGDSVFSEETLAHNGASGSNQNPSKQLVAKGSTGANNNLKDDDADKSETLTEVESALLGHTGDSMFSELSRRHVVTRQTDEGLVIELFDIESEPLFDALSHEPTKTLQELTKMLISVLDLVTNQVAISAHIRSRPVVARDPRIWSVSMDRAEGTRQLLEDAGLNPIRFERIVGYGDRDPVAGNPLAIRNNRIEITLIRSDQ